MTALTAKQNELLSYITVYQEGKGRSPSFDEMRQALALKSKSGVHRLVKALEERGYIRRIPNRARCLEVLDEPRLPEKQIAPATTMSNADLVREAKRRGLVVGHFHREKSRIGDMTINRRTFVELRA